MHAQWYPILIAAISGLAGAIIGSGGIYAWFKVGPERRKIIADIHSSMLEDTHAAYHQLSEEFSQLKMVNIGLEQENEDCRRKLFEMEASIRALREDINRHGRMAEFARRKAHLAMHSLGGYELHVEYLLDRMRAENMTLTPLDRPLKLRRELQIKMNELEQLESLSTMQAITESLEPTGREIPITDSQDPASE